MATRELSNLEIDACCLRIIDEVRNNYPHYLSHVIFLYQYGCRINELFTNRISLDGINQKVMIKPQKGNKERVLNYYNSTSPAITGDILLRSDVFSYNKRNLQRVIHKVNPYRAIFAGNKNINAHIFRHNYIRKKLGEGLQIESINNLLGYTTQSVVDSYLAQKIYILT